MQETGQAGSLRQKAGMCLQQFPEVVFPQIIKWTAASMHGDATGSSIPPRSSGETPALHRQPVLYAAGEGKACSCDCSSTNMAPALFVCFK